VRKTFCIFEGKFVIQKTDECTRPLLSIETLIIGEAVRITNPVIDNRVHLIMKNEMTYESIGPVIAGDEFTLVLRMNVKATRRDGIRLEFSEVFRVRLDRVGGRVNRHCEMF
jgi:hypothetical protein